MTKQTRKNEQKEFVVPSDDTLLESSIPTTENTTFKENIKDEYLDVSINLWC